MNWYALYTNPRAEKKVAASLAQKGLEVYLPLVKTLKQWSDRKKWVEEPLFRSYIFVRIDKVAYYEVLNTPGVVRYVTFEGRAVVVPAQQIEAVRRFVEDREEIPEGADKFQPGKIVGVVKGPMKGLLGELISIKGKYRVRIEVAAVGQAIYLTIPMSYLKISK